MSVVKKSLRVVGFDVAGRVLRTPTFLGGKEAGSLVHNIFRLALPLHITPIAAKHRVGIEKLKDNRLPWDQDGLDTRT
jgi:hypothetical protein